MESKEKNYDGQENRVMIQEQKEPVLAQGQQEHQEQSEQQARQERQSQQMQEGQSQQTQEGEGQQTQQGMQGQKACASGGFHLWDLAHLFAGTAILFGYGRGIGTGRAGDGADNWSANTALSPIGSSQGAECIRGTAEIGI